MKISFFKKAVGIIILVNLYFCAPPSKIRKDRNTLVYWLPGNPRNLNPIIAEDAYTSKVTSQIYESLLERDVKTLKMKGLLAKSWEISNGNKEYRFHLRKDVIFHDGRPFTSKDVMFTYKKMMHPSTPNPHRKVYFLDVMSISAPDKFTIVFRLKKPYFMSLEHLGGFEILPEHIFSKVKDFVMNEHNRGKPVGTGPFVMKKWLVGQKILLKRNESYWGRKPDYKGLEFKILQSQEVALQALKKQELDTMSLNPFQWTRQTGKEKFNNNFNKYKYLSRGYRYIGYNTRKYPFNIKEVRLAMTYLIDKKKILEQVLENLGVITTGNFWVKSPQYNQKLKPRKFDPRKAVQLLKQAGFKDTDNDGVLDKNGKPLSFTLVVPAGVKFYQRFVPVVKEDLKKAGIDLQIRLLQFQAVIEKINRREFDAVMLGWSMGIEGDPYQLWHSSQIDKGHNFTGFTTKEMDRIIEGARTEFNEKKRNAMYHKFHKILYDNQPYTFLYTTHSLVAVHNRFENVIAYPVGLDMLHWTLKYTK